MRIWNPFSPPVDRGIRPFLIGYVAYQGFQIVYNPIQLETAVEYRVYDTIDTDGITVRNETLIPEEADGYLYYQTENGGGSARAASLRRCLPARRMP